MPTSIACCPSTSNDTCVLILPERTPSSSGRRAPPQRRRRGRRGPGPVGPAWKHQHPSADRLCQCRQSVARAGGSTRNGACAAHRAGGGTGPPGARADGGEPDAEPDRRADRRRACLRRPEGPAGFPAGELAPTERDHDRSAGAWLCLRRLGSCRVALRAGSDLACRAAALGEPRGRAAGDGQAPARTSIARRTCWSWLRSPWPWFCWSAPA